MKALVVEDDFTSRRVLQKFLERYGECDVTVNGEEAETAFAEALSSDTPYQLVCLDIYLPGMNGLEILSRLRKQEQDKGIQGLAATKIIMITVARDAKTILPAFRSQCDAYLIKPFDGQKLDRELRELGLI